MKKIEVDIATLKNAGLSNIQIANIVRDANPDHWTNKLASGHDCYTLQEFSINNPEYKKARGNDYVDNLDPVMNFYTAEDADFVVGKCQLLVEMTNFSFAVNIDWNPDWNNKDEKKYGIIIQNGKAVIRENEIHNIFVFGISVKTRFFAMEMLEEYKERIEIFFNKNISYSFLSVKSKIYASGNFDFKTTDPNTLIGRGLFSENNNFNEGSENIKTNNEMSSEVFEKKDIVLKRKRKKLYRIKKEQIPFIEKCLLRGVPQEDIAKTIGCSQSTISSLKKSLKIPTIPKKKKGIV